MTEMLRNTHVGDNVRVKIANVYEYGTVTSIEEHEVLIQIANEPSLTRKVSFEDFIGLGYEIVRSR